MSISVSEMIHTENSQDLAVKATAVNNELKRYSEQNNFYLIQKMKPQAKVKLI